MKKTQAFNSSERIKRELTVLEMEMLLPPAVDAKEVYGSPYGRVIEICLSWLFSVGEILMTKTVSGKIVTEKFFILRKNKGSVYLELPLKNVPGLCEASEKPSSINLVLPKEILHKMNTFSLFFGMKDANDVIAQSIALMRKCLDEKKAGSSFYTENHQEALGEIEEQYFPFWKTAQLTKTNRRKTDRSC